jgi:NAD-dependent deacetylase
LVRRRVINNLLDTSIKEAMTCSICVVVGTSLQVYPANTLPDYVPFGSQMIIIDPIIDKINFDENRNINFINKKASEGIKLVFDSLTK